MAFGALMLIGVSLIGTSIYVAFTAPECVMTEDDTIIFLHEQTGDLCQLSWEEDGWSLVCGDEEKEDALASTLFPVG